MAGPGFTALFGGGNIYQANPSFLSLNPLTASIQLSWPIEQSFATPNVAEIIEVNASTPGLVVQLDDATIATTGYTSLFNNVGANSFQVQDAGGNTLMVVASGQVWQIYLADNSTTNGTYRVFQYGAGASNANAAALAGAGLVAIGTTLNETMVVHEFNANYQSVAGDRATFQVWTGGVGAFGLPDATVVGTNWFIAFKNAGGGNVTVTDISGHNIDGSAQLLVPPESSTYLISDGTQWFTLGFGQTINSTFDFISIDVSGGGDFVLAGNQLNRISYRFTGVLTANRNIVVPNVVQQYWVDNETTGPFTLTVKTAGGTGVGILQGNREILYCDSTNVVLANTAGAFTFANGTAAGPSVTFTSDGTTGLYFSVPGQLNFATAGVQRMYIDSTGRITVVQANGAAPYSMTVNSPNGASEVVLFTTSLPSSSIHPLVTVRSTATNGIASISIQGNSGTPGVSDLNLSHLFGNGQMLLSNAGQLQWGTNNTITMILDNAGNLELTAGANGTLTMIGLSANTATAGGTQAVPATVKGYLNWTLNGVIIKVPYFSA
jgi:hypothetical protein